MIRSRHVLAPLAGWLIIGILSTACSAEIEEFDWRQDWSVEDGFAITIDTEGYLAPTAIAFVPEPGDDPKDPLYFVTELNGTVKVVTNDRTVSTFAENVLQPGLTLTEVVDSQAGMAGICLDPAKGYVFATFTYPTEDTSLRNNITRFETVPTTFSVEPVAQVSFTDVFSRYRTGPSHMIGACQVHDDLLYASVGDGGATPLESQRLNTLLGKVVRMTLDGNPVDANPFYEDEDIRRAENYIWAYGLRNPFGLKAVNDKLFVADNGVGLDRFLQIREAENYLWDATDRSITAKADFVLSPSHGVTHVDYNPLESALFPEAYRGRFFMTMAGNPFDAVKKYPGVLAIEYDLEEGKLLSAPKDFLKYRGDPGQILAGIALGPDGLYFSPILPNRQGLSAIFKVSYDPENQHSYTFSEDIDGNFLIHQKGCVSCHKVNETTFGELGGGGTVGPTLQTDALVARLDERLHSDQYAQSVRELDQLDTEPFASFREARQDVLNEEGLDRIRTWIEYRVQEPRFDDPRASMPNLGITGEEAVIIANALLERNEGGFLRRTAELFVPMRAKRVHLAYYFAVGFALGGIFLGLSYLTFRKLYLVFRER